jgi:hypothetical protein
VSYDLVFWRQAGPVAEPPAAIYRDLLEGRQVDGLLELEVDGFLRAILERFPDAVREPNGSAEWICWSAPDAHGSFQAEWSAQHVIVFCRWLSNEDMNRLIDIALEHDCRLYDPQTDERFD